MKLAMTEPHSVYNQCVAFTVSLWALNVLKRVYRSSNCLHKVYWDVSRGSTKFDTLLQVIVI